MIPVGDDASTMSPMTCDPFRGRCSMYHTRPMICRMFGFAAVRAKASGTLSFSGSQEERQGGRQGGARLLQFIRSMMMKKIRLAQ